MALLGFQSWIYLITENLTKVAGLTVNVPHFHGTAEQSWKTDLCVQNTPDSHGLSVPLLTSPHWN